VQPQRFTSTGRAADAIEQIEGGSGAEVVPAAERVPPVVGHDLKPVPRHRADRRALRLAPANDDAAHRAHLGAPDQQHALGPGASAQLRAQPVQPLQLGQHAADGNR
jgi:hypothetical protein